MRLRNHLASAPCYSLFHFGLGLETVTSFLSTIIAKLKEWKNEKKKKKESGYFIKFITRITQFNGISEYYFHLDRLYNTINDTWTIFMFKYVEANKM